MHIILRLFLQLDKWRTALLAPAEPWSTRVLVALAVGGMLTTWVVQYAELFTGSWSDVLASIVADASLSLVGLLVFSTGALSVAMGRAPERLAPAVSESRARAVPHAGGGGGGGGGGSGSGATAARAEDAPAGGPARAAGDDRKLDGPAASHGGAASGVQMRTPLLQAGRGADTKDYHALVDVGRAKAEDEAPPYPLLDHTWPSSIQGTDLGRASSNDNQLHFLTAVFVCCYVSSVYCDLGFNFSIEIDGSLGVGTAVAFAVGDVTENFVAVGTYIYVTLYTWALDTRARALLSDFEHHSKAVLHGHGAATRDSPRTFLRRYFELQHDLHRVVQMGGTLPALLLVLAVVESAGIVTTIFGEDVEHDHGTGYELCMLRVYAIVAFLVSGMVRASGRLEEVAGELSEVAMRHIAYTGAAGADPGAGGAASASAALRSSAGDEASWLLFSDAVKKHPLEFHSGSFTFTGEFGATVTLALLALGLTIIGIRLPEL